MIELNKICKYYNKGSIKAIDDISLKIEKGEMVALIGKSGSGKSTLLNVIGLIDSFTSGEYTFDDTKIENNNRKLQETIRRENMGYVVQSYALIPDKTAFDNIALPLNYRKISNSEIKEKITSLAKQLDITHILKKYPHQISGGESQRVALARALITQPSIILADEPTGALDTSNESIILDIFKELNRQGITLLISTHDETVANICSRKIALSDGRIISEK